MKSTPIIVTFGLCAMPTVLTMPTTAWSLDQRAITPTELTQEFEPDAPVKAQCPALHVLLEGEDCNILFRPMKTGDAEIYLINSHERDVHIPVKTAHGPALIDVATVEKVTDKNRKADIITQYATQLRLAVEKLQNSKSDEKVDLSDYKLFTVDWKSLKTDKNITTVNLKTIELTPQTADILDFAKAWLEHYKDNEPEKVAPAPEKKTPPAPKLQPQ